jgi:hypothetical protein
VNQKDNLKKPLAKVKITKEEMKTTLENMKKLKLQQTFQKVLSRGRT